MMVAGYPVYYPMPYPMDWNGMPYGPTMVALPPHHGGPHIEEIVDNLPALQVKLFQSKKY